MKAKETAGKIKKTSVPKGKLSPYITDFLEGIDGGKTELHLRKGAKVFSQGQFGRTIYFIRSGKIKLTVVSAAGKEVVLAKLGSHAFFGEGCLVGQTIRVSTATATYPSTLFCIQDQAMLAALQTEPDLAEKFTAALLARNADLEEDLCDQLFNHSEKRLARVLLKLARFGQSHTIGAVKIPPTSHAALAEMVGTSVSQVTHFMNKFKALGFIEDNQGITVRAELLTDVVLHD